MTFKHRGIEGEAHWDSTQGLFRGKLTISDGFSEFLGHNGLSLKKNFEDCVDEYLDEIKPLLNNG